MIEYLLELIGLEIIRDKEPVKPPYNFLSDKEIWNAISHLDPAEKMEIMMNLFGRKYPEHIPHGK